MYCNLSDLCSVLPITLYVTVAIYTPAIDRVDDTGGRVAVRRGMRALEGARTPGASDADAAWRERSLHVWP